MASVSVLGNTVESKGLFVYGRYFMTSVFGHVVLYFWFADPDLAPLTGTRVGVGEVNLQLV